MNAEHQSLKPCPFCGGEVQLETGKSRAGTLYQVVCRNNVNRGGSCFMAQVLSRSAEAAIARWNMRKPEEELRVEVERLNGLRPDAPPRSPDGMGLPRYGLRWNGPQQPLAVPMNDGYWTPWHLAEKIGIQLDVSEDTLATIRGCLKSAEEDIDKLKAENEALRKQIADLCPLKNVPPQDFRASNKCLACGEYHHGLGGLPCPKCTPVAYSAMAKEAKL